MSSSVNDVREVLVLDHYEDEMYYHVSSIRSMYQAAYTNIRQVHSDVRLPGRHLCMVLHEL